MYFTINDLDFFDLNLSYLVGTTNMMIKEYKKSNVHLVINLDDNSVTYPCINIKKILKNNNQEKKFMKNLCQMINKDSNDINWK